MMTYVRLVYKKFSPSKIGVENSTFIQTCIFEGCNFFPNCHSELNINWQKESRNWVKINFFKSDVNGSCLSNSILLRENQIRYFCTSRGHSQTTWTRICSFLTTLPTSSGRTWTFQLPATYNHVEIYRPFFSLPKNSAGLQNLKN